MRRARVNQGLLLFDAPGIRALQFANVLNKNLDEGTRVDIQMDLNVPVARAFDLAGAKSIFRPIMPTGLRLLDIEAVGNRTVLVHGRVEGPPSNQPNVEFFQFQLATLAIARVIWSSWGGKLLVGIGLALLLDAIVKRVRGRGFLPSASSIILPVVVVGALLVGAGLLSRGRR